ncbi:hypothetical protein [Pseudomonas asplenii]|uniref:hypothetical protein n=1 Tax=Pseudomonas asplenii TaxID=53407 RepID=UPI0009B79FBE|nr:hypothetical protein [Pseudomonas fuscovaginae]
MPGKKDLEERLQAVGSRYGCDKVVTHHYHRFYANHLLDYVGRPFKLLEIGVGGEGTDPGGASLKLWAEVFPLATIHGLDLYDKRELDSERVRTFVVDQGDPLALDRFMKRYGPFDIIIDDGSHRRSDQLTSLFNLITGVVAGGYYILEDYFTSYWPVYDGSTLAKDFLDTPVRWLKQAIDIINRNNLLSLEMKALIPNWEIEALHVYPGVAFLRKGVGPNRSALPGGDFVENQLQLDELRYGRYKTWFFDHARDPMNYLALLHKFRQALDAEIARLQGTGKRET